ncbi:MAG: PilN domain-containing protein [Xanthomonadales bacterium]|nr:PilN domain-containing protein [Xanthomonadales bacterium]
MAKINLLPWRAERRKQRQKQFYTLLGMVAIAAILAVFGAKTYFDSLIANQQARNTYLQNEIVEVDKKIKEIEALDKKRADLLQRKQVIEELQSSRSQMVHLFDELVKTIPDGIRLTSIKQKGAELTLAGVSQSNARVSSYIRALEGSGWMTKPDLSIIEAKGTEKGMPYVFNLKVTLVKPKDPKDEEAAAAGGAQ